MKRIKPNTLCVVNVVTNKIEYVDTRTWNIRKRWWTKARIPGEVRPSRMPGGSGFRNNWQNDA